MLSEKLNGYNVILASKSPRRKLLLEGLEVQFTIDSKDVVETFPPRLKREEIAIYLSELKANAFTGFLKDNDLLISSDTIVWMNNEVLHKPINIEDAYRILTKLSGATHEVITAVSFKTIKKIHTFIDITKVTFNNLSQAEIEFYVNKYLPFDKAGAYGAQEWIGYVAINKIEGSYFNVMGLPTEKLYKEIIEFVK
jgi:septum formation protein